MERTAAATLASLLQARANCEASGNTEWKLRHEDRARQIVRDLLPSGSGFDAGTVLDLSASGPERLVFGVEFHHMNETGYYDGWSVHSVIVTPSLASGFNVRVTGRDRNDIKDHIAEVYSDALGALIRHDAASDHYSTVPMLAPVASERGAL